MKQQDDLGRRGLGIERLGVMLVVFAWPILMAGSLSCQSSPQAPDKPVRSLDLSRFGHRPCESTLADAGELAFLSDSLLVGTVNLISKSGNILPTNVFAWALIVTKPGATALFRWINRPAP
jgi:hypothetical protein